MKHVLRVAAVLTLALVACLVIACAAKKTARSLIHTNKKQVVVTGKTDGTCKVDKGKIVVHKGQKEFVSWKLVTQTSDEYEVLFNKGTKKIPCDSGHDPAPLKGDGDESVCTVDNAAEMEYFYSVNRNNSPCMPDPSVDVQQ